MVYQVKDTKQLNALMKPARTAVIETQLVGGYDKLEKLEKRVDKLQKAYAMDHALLLSYVAQFETLKRRVMELESKNIS
jgi:hypothetical protein